jgi:hypothetical protein
MTQLGHDPQIMTRSVRIRRDRVFLRRNRIRTVSPMPAKKPITKPITDADCHAAQLIALQKTWNYSY